MTKVYLNNLAVAIFSGYVYPVHLKARHYFVQSPGGAPERCCGMCILAGAEQGLHDAHASLVLTCCTHTHSFCIQS